MDADQPERTPDGRYIVVKGRRWRATDPEIPEDVAAGLRRHLMAARRGVAASHRNQDPAAEKTARSRVHTAKVALGERGTPWWEQSLAERRRRWEDGAAELDATGKPGQRTARPADG
ncbi:MULTISPECIES: hypothetical protein [Streptomyces]|uniref:Biopolymer transporter Tol n=1 Tax=Streptomyces cyaneofuscatus TaxID=66883 RepID=A0ABZ1F3W4_9ACTN|nr:hypothetical protein [Streptomyces cyaneofuscatus]WSB10834.1 hypothetical protein OG849_28105 [Streptomyces cyaneofuscatus]WSD45633.1 hypothetical protein OG857_07300 [Streptomyces cyaneofuscatus]WTA88989.1 hypothetical protein OG323_08195 [Streptomyces cyaneofuscatus]